LAEEFGDSEHSLQAESNSPSEHIELKEVMAALETLPIKSREVLSMIAIGGMSYAEAAEQLDVPIGTIMSRVARARSGLAEKLAATQIRSSGGHHGIH
jgi:RNA polymerase sigma-70 factor (ECF subfamily)